MPALEAGGESDRCSLLDRLDDEHTLSAPSPSPVPHDDGEDGFVYGASVFNTRGQRLNEIDLDARQLPKTIAEMTDDDWGQAKAALRAFDEGER